MIIVLRPFKHVELFKPQSIGLNHFDEGREELSNQEKYSKRLYIGELDARNFSTRGFNQQMMLLKETTRHRSKIFHICDAYDIASVKCQLEMEEADSLNRFKVITQDRASITSKISAEETK